MFYMDRLDLFDLTRTVWIRFSWPGWFGQLDTCFGTGGLVSLEPIRVVQASFSWPNQVGWLDKYIYMGGLTNSDLPIVE